MKKAIISCIAYLGISTTVDLYAIERPTMGWSSWNTYRVNINETLIKSQADACVKLGLRDAGYKYINIDDGFFGGRDMKTGHLLIHPIRFPNGIKPVADYIHSLGLKAGIYSDAGANTCGCWYDNDSIAQNVGFYGHDQQDADMYFKEYGFDFIKIDFCGGNPTANSHHFDLDPRERYTAISNAIKATGRSDVRMNVCRWDYPGTWVKDVAVSWRMSHDISCRWSSVKDIIEQNLYLSAYAVNGHYNDMDMLEVGRTLKPEEDITHFGIWCIMSSPLLIGCDMTKLKPTTLALLKNKELIAINQDALGLQAYVVKHDMNDGTYVLVKDVEVLNGLTRVIALYNPTDTVKTISITPAELELAGDIKIRDLIEQKDVKIQKPLKAISKDIAPHSTAIYKLTATQRLERTMYEAETAFLTDYQELYNAQAVGTAYYEKDDNASGGMKVTNLGYRPENDLQWRNVYSQEGGEYCIKVKTIGFTEKQLVFLAINDSDAYMIKLEDAKDGMITLHIHLNKGNNIIRLSNSKGAMPDIDFMYLEKN